MVIMSKNYADVRYVVEKWRERAESACFRTGLRRFQERLKKCVQMSGDQFEVEDA